MFCAQQVVQLHRHESQFKRQGASLVVIGQGFPDSIIGFRAHTGFDGALYTDPTRRLYRELGLRRRKSTSLNTRTARRIVEAMRQGFRQRRTQGDLWQQGGVFVADTDGLVHYVYRSQHAGDHPEPAEIVRALERASPSEVA